MVTARLIPIPAFTDNYIWMVHKNGHAIVVDPGQSAPVEKALSDLDLVLDAILLTHHHGDHVGGVLALQSQTGARVYGPATENLPACDQALAQGDTVQLPAVGLELSVLDVPGHTAGHIAYFGKLDTGKPLLFCGDTLFAAGCGRLFEGTPAQMAQSLGKLSVLPTDTLVCCAHEYTLANLRWALEVEPDNGNLRQRWQYATQLREKGEPTLPSTVGDELETNPFLRTGQAAVALAAAKHAGRALQDQVDVFASLRQWKNDFK